MDKLTCCNESLKVTVKQIQDSKLQKKLSPSLSPSSNPYKTENLNTYKSWTLQQFTYKILSLKESKGDWSDDATKFKFILPSFLNILIDNLYPTSKFDGLKEKSFETRPKDDKLE